MKATGQIYDPAALRWAKDAGTQRTEGWMGPHSITGRFRKKKYCPFWDPKSGQSSAESKHLELRCSGLLNGEWW
jgi:hypothetical protein